MLPKSQRLNLKTDFSRVVKGKRIESPHFIFYLNSNDSDFAKVGISIRTKNFGKAHERNRARRLTSQAVQSNYDNLPKDRDLIIMPKSATLETEVEVLTKEISDVLSRYIEKN